MWLFGDRVLRDDYIKMRVLGGVLVLIPSHWCCCKNGGVGHTESPQGVCIEGIHMRAEQAGSHPQVGKTGLRRLQAGWYLDLRLQSLELWEMFLLFESHPIWGLPWWLCDKESACQCRRHYFDPLSREIPYAEEQLSLCATAKSRCSRARELQLRSSWAATTEARVP